MSLDLVSFSAKLRRFREMFEESAEALATATGIPLDVIAQLEGATRTPTGDEVLILADHFLCDFRLFISNELAAPIDRTEKLFRAYSTELSSRDRWAIQEFLYLCECESFLVATLDRPPPIRFVAPKVGNFFKTHGHDAAHQLRGVLGYASNQVPDVFGDLRRLGVHLFRRRLENANISGLFVNHPTAGPSVLVNFDEDVYRQRFTAAHETAHALFDIDDEYVVSLSSRHDLPEVRANAFAGAFLVPPELIASLPDSSWTADRLVDLAGLLRVNAKVLVIALEREGRLTKGQSQALGALRVPRGAKDDPDLPPGLTAQGRSRKLALMERGISSYYAELCWEAYQRQMISGARLAEMLLVEESELREIAKLFNVKGL
jgi:Zn-dependent peptidase ImmA (M78 family)